MKNIERLLCLCAKRLPAYIEYSSQIVGGHDTTSVMRAMVLCPSRGIVERVAIDQSRLNRGQVYEFSQTQANVLI
jgi:hypothetical protein